MSRSGRTPRRSASPRTPCGATPAWSGVTCTGTGAAAVPTALALRGLGLNGTLTCLLGNASALTSIDLGLNALQGTIPSCLTSGLSALTLLNLGQNRLVGTLPPQLPLASGKLKLAIFDNQLSGIVPSTYSSLAALALAFNPELIGSLPPGVNTTNLQGWTGTALAACASAAPPAGTGCLYGTSISLDRPLLNILLDIKAAVDPGGTVLSRWNTSAYQPCPPWTGQSAASPGYGRWLPGLFKPSAFGAATGTSYCQDIGMLPTAPHVYTSPATLDVLANPAGNSAGGAGLPANTALAGGISSLSLNGLGLSGSVPVQLRELRSTTIILLSRNALHGSLPSAWGQPVSWNTTAPSAGFDSCTLLDFGQNQLNGSLPANLSAIGSGTGLSVYDNAFSGSVPASYTQFAWIALAYNPLLVGALPPGFNSAKLYAWSAYYSGFFSWWYVYTAGAGGWYGTPPYYSTGYGTGFLYGTSIGLDRPLVSILLDIKAAVDPGGAVLSAWNASHLQPCRPWGYSTSVQSSTSPVAGKSWTYISTTGVANSAEYCQDWQGSGYDVYQSPTTYSTNAAQAGGISALWLRGLGLNGTLPVQLQELLTASQVTLAVNSLGGTIPAAWCARQQAACSRARR